MKSIVIYYSRSGNTEKLAQRIAGDLECDTVKIVPEDAYGNYVASVARVMKERGQKAIPAFVTPIPDLSDCDVVLLGYPIWAQDLPVFVADFVGKCELLGKTVVPFATFGGTGINWTMKTLRRVCRGAQIQLPFESGMFKKDNYDSWITSVRGLMQDETR